MKMCTLLKRLSKLSRLNRIMNWCRNEDFSHVLHSMTNILYFQSIFHKIAYHPSVYRIEFNSKPRISIFANNFFDVQTHTRVSISLTLWNKFWTVRYPATSGQTLFNESIFENRCSKTLCVCSVETHIKCEYKPSNEIKNTLN